MVSLIVAVADNGVIGAEGGMPWSLPADMKFFKATTMGKPIIMGRKTYESIGMALPGRANIVITRDEGFSAPGATVVDSVDAALKSAGTIASANESDEIMVIGGAEIYAAALPKADRIYLTEIHSEPEGDTHFPKMDKSRWTEISREDHPAEDARPAYSFVVLERAA